MATQPSNQGSPKHSITLYSAFQFSRPFKRERFFSAILYNTIIEQYTTSVVLATKHRRKKARKKTDVFQENLFNLTTNSRNHGKIPKERTSPPWYIINEL